MTNAVSISPTTLVVAAQITDVKSSGPEIDISPLAANHEEPETCLVLHCVNTNAETVVVLVCDT